MFGHLLEVGVGQKIQQIVHRRIFAAPVPERDQLIVEVACRLSRQPRKIHVAGALTFRAVTRGAGEHARGHGVGRLRGGLLAQRRRKHDRSKQGECRRESMRHRDAPSRPRDGTFAHRTNRGNAARAPRAAALAHGSVEFIFDKLWSDRTACPRRRTTSVCRHRPRRPCDRSTNAGRCDRRALLLDADPDRVLIAIQRISTTRWV
jgi:hypothetical protein